MLIIFSGLAVISIVYGTSSLNNLQPKIVNSELPPPHKNINATAAAKHQRHISDDNDHDPLWGPSGLHVAVAVSPEPENEHTRACVRARAHNISIKLTNKVRASRAPQQPTAEHRRRVPSG